MNSNEILLKISSIDEKIAIIKSKSPLLIEIDEACLLLSFEKKLIDLKDREQVIAKKSNQMDEKIRSINQSIPRSIDGFSRRYLDLRIKLHFFEVEAWKQEGVQVSLAQKLKAHEHEKEKNASRLSLLENISKVQRALLDQSDISIPTSLEQHYLSLKNIGISITNESSCTTSRSSSSCCKLPKLTSKGSVLSMSSSALSANQEKTNDIEKIGNTFPEISSAEGKSDATLQKHKPMPKEFRVDKPSPYNDGNSAIGSFDQVKSNDNP
ncbi:hypothetical protein HK100_005575 [Physocladia obscura]|uniref:Uncharacterized protein n=1 Tax=Physocladia obscura TaxID=109957 RepID=A0AAD5XJ91_9FUNG|nr:hypothetical protein HK100_005575 [Physocladia obscura]